MLISEVRGRARISQVQAAAPGKHPRLVGKTQGQKLNCDNIGPGDRGCKHREPEDQQRARDREPKRPQKIPLQGLQ